MPCSIALAVAAATVTLAAGCGGDAEPTQNAAVKSKPKPPAETPSTVIEIASPKTGDKPFRFDQKKLAAKAGLIEIRFVNDDTNAHNIRIQTGEKCCDAANDVGGTNTISPGQKETARVRLEAGKYWFLCSINSHYDTDQGKMKGVLTVS